MKITGPRERDPKSRRPPARLGPFSHSRSPTGGGTLKRKLGYYDRLVGLAFHPQYSQEYERLFPSDSPSLELIFSPNNEIDKFKRKWGLRFVMNPEDVKRRLVSGQIENVEGGAFLDYEDEIKIIPWQKRRQGTTLDLSRNVRGKKYLTVQLDITRDLEKTLNDIRGYINYYRKLTKFQPTSKRQTPPGIANHWLIYKMRDHDGKSLLQITRELFNVSGTPAYNTTTDARYKQVARAYKKARQIISQITPRKPSS